MACLCSTISGTSSGKMQKLGWLSRQRKNHLETSFFLINLFILLYNIVLVLPYIDLNLPWVYICSPSWTPVPPPSPSHPSGSSQCTSPEHPVSCIKPGLAIHRNFFVYISCILNGMVWILELLTRILQVIFPGGFAVWKNSRCFRMVRRLIWWLTASSVVTQREPGRSFMGLSATAWEITLNIPTIFCL